MLVCTELTPLLSHANFSLPVFLVAWASVPAVMPSSATQFVSTSFAHHSCLVFLHIQESVRHTGLCVSCRCEPSLAAVSPIGELVAGTERPVSDQTGGGSPRLAGSETRGAGRENVASCSASSITPAHRETRRAAYQTALSSIRLKI